MKLLFKNGIYEGQELEIEDGLITIGSSDDNALQLEVDDIAAHHAKLEKNEDGGWIIALIDSGYPLTLNGAAIRIPTALKNKDIIGVGSLRIMVDEVAPQVILRLKPSSSKVHSAKKETTEEISDALKNGKLNIFGPGLKNEKMETTNDTAATDRHKRLRHNILFAVAVIAFAVIAISLFFIFEEKQNTMATPDISQRQQTPFLLFYHKEKSDSDNIFSFNLLIENDEATFTIDDLASERHYQKKINLKNDDEQLDALSTLKSSMASTNIMKAQSPVAGRAPGGEMDRRRMILAMNREFNDIEVINSAIPNSFSIVEDAIASFAEHFGLYTVAMTAEELAERAKMNFDKAEELYLNRGARASNLRDAIARYQLTLDYLEQFSPKPTTYTIAQQRLKEAHAERNKRLADLRFGYTQAARLNKLSEARNYLLDIMALSDPASSSYDNARKLLIDVDKVIRSQDRR